MTTNHENETVNSGEDMYKIGENYFIRTVTYHFVGRLIEKYQNGPISELIFTNCSWIAESGRYADALKSGEFSEIEPYPSSNKVSINRTAIVDGSEWKHELPTQQR